MLPSFKIGAIYLLQSTHKFWNHYFVIFLRSFGTRGIDDTITHLPHGFTPTNTCPTKNSKGRCLGFATFECCAIFQINWESFVHRDQLKKYVLWYVAPKPCRWQMSSFGSWTGFVVNQLRTHHHIWLIPQIANYVESKLSTWHKHSILEHEQGEELIQSRNHPN